jgi:hypothetical protein
VGKVVEVVSGDTIVVKDINAGGAERRISLSRCVQVQLAVKYVSDPSSSTMCVACRRSGSRVCTHRICMYCAIGWS